ncbi:Phosphoglycerate kinase [Ammonifex degensii KC4]|uniref:Phosphoglycerate kinase n=1 Tax=Ammonifex degensii (strain DSM 10501 / KC4) TaxID=429009 RepID=C9R8T1_AMMDK|nr:phosphoglycerate kinase [Ammonifex degensii]ACX52710.1 Phosphoglycerate kinase [Ammonifex degensii KC4]
MTKKTVKDVEVRGKRVLVRVDFNVPLKDGKVTDDTRLRAALPTIEYLCQQGAKVILVSHLGRPKGAPDESLRLDPVAQRLEELLGRPVRKLDSCVGPEVEEAVAALNPGDVLLLENIRFHPGETKNDPELAQGLAKLCDIYVNDAFGTAHRAHASTVGVAKLRPAVAGFLMAKEIEALSRLLTSPARPFVALIGGAKISDKIGVLRSLLTRVDSLLIGGGMANTFLAAQGYNLGRSLLEPDQLEQARSIMEEARERGVNLVLPRDLVVAANKEAGAEHRVVPVNEVPEGWMALDVGPATVEEFCRILAGARTIFWNGPLGYFEQPPYDAGTVAVARALPATAETIVGGGDTVAAVTRAGVADRITHISTGGGASLEFLEGKELPGIAVLEDK